MVEELELKEILEATKNGNIGRWHRSSSGISGPKFEVEYKGWKLTLNCQVDMMRIGNNPVVPVVYRDWSLTTEHEELTKQGIKWEKHYTIIHDGLNQVDVAHSTSWSYIHHRDYQRAMGYSYPIDDVPDAWWVSHRMPMDPKQFEILDELWSEAGLRAS